MTNKNWMWELPPELRDISVIYLAIPGSHNSMTYGITASSEVAPDADDSVHKIYWLFPWFVRRWSKNQNVNITEQLELGVRYFDLRIVQQNDNFYYAHGLFAMEIWKPLQEICEFLSANRGELVVIDFQHNYNLNVEHHKRLHTELLEFFGSRLYSTTDGPLTECTLNRCRAMGRQIVLIYRRSPIPLPYDFWPSQAWPTPWPNKDSAKALKQFLDDALLSRKPLQGYVSQCVLTPSGRYIALRPFSSLRRTAKKVDKTLHPWINEQLPGPFDNEKPAQKVNVFIADFVELNDGQFCNWVIGLNRKFIECFVNADATNDADS